MTTEQLKFMQTLTNNQKEMYFKLRSDGKGVNLIFSCKALKEQLMDFYNVKKKQTVATGYSPSKTCSFLVVEVQEITDAKVFELFPIL